MLYWEVAHEKTIKILNVLTPFIIILILGLIYFTDFIINQDETGKIGFIPILLLYPLLFIVHGATTRVTKGNIYFNLGLSILGYILAMTLWLNSSGIIYILFYILSWFIGYGIVSLIIHIKNS